MVRRKLWNAAGIAAAFLPLVLISCSDDNNNSGVLTGTEISGHTPRTWPTRQVIKEPRGLNS